MVDVAMLMLNTIFIYFFISEIRPIIFFKEDATREQMTKCNKDIKMLKSIFIVSESILLSEYSALRIAVANFRHYWYQSFSVE